MTPPGDGITYRQWAAVHITAAFIASEGWRGNDKPHSSLSCAVKLTDVLIEEIGASHRKPHEEMQVREGSHGYLFA